jgi:hypothetical protein
LIKVFNHHPKAILIEYVSVWQEDGQGHFLIEKGIRVKTCGQQANAPVKANTRGDFEYLEPVFRV